MAALTAPGISLAGNVSVSTYAPFSSFATPSGAPASPHLMVTVPKAALFPSGVSYVVGFEGATPGLLTRRKFAAALATTGNSQATMDACFNNLTASELVTVSSVALPSETNFAMEYTGWLVVPQTGDYTFGLRSDDGSDLALYMNWGWDVVTSAYG